MANPKPQQFYLICTPFPAIPAEQKKWLKDRKNFTFFIPPSFPLPLGANRLETVIGDVTRLAQSTIVKFYRKACEENLDHSTDAEQPATTMERWRVAQRAAWFMCEASGVEWRGEMRDWLNNALLRYGLKGIPRWRDAKAQDGGARSLVGQAGTSSIPGSDTSSPRTFDHCSRSFSLDRLLPPRPTLSQQRSMYNASIGQDATSTKNNSNMPSLSVPKEKYVSVTTITTTDTLDVTPRESVHNPEPGKKRGLKEYQEEVQVLMKDIELLAAKEQRLNNLRKEKLQELAGVNAEMAEVSIDKRRKCEEVTELMQGFCKDRATL